MLFCLWHILQWSTARMIPATLLHSFCHKGCEAVGFEKLKWWLDLVFEWMRKESTGTLARKSSGTGQWIKHSPSVLPYATERSSCGTFPLHISDKTMQSSAKKRLHTEESKAKSFRWTRKRRGPRTKPWGRSLDQIHVGWRNEVWPPPEKFGSVMTIQYAVFDFLNLWFLVCLLFYSI